MVSQILCYILTTEAFNICLENGDSNRVSEMCTKENPHTAWKAYILKLIQCIEIVLETYFLAFNSGWDSQRILRWIPESQRISINVSPVC